MTNWATSTPPPRFREVAVRAGGGVDSKGRDLVGGGVCASLGGRGVGRASLATNDDIVGGETHQTHWTLEQSTLLLWVVFPALMTTLWKFGLIQTLLWTWAAVCSAGIVKGALKQRR